MEEEENSYSYVYFLNFEEKSVLGSYESII